MIANTFVLVCAAFGLVAGSFDFAIPQQTSSQYISLPVSSQSSSINTFPSFETQGSSSAIAIPSFSTQGSSSAIAIPSFENQGSSSSFSFPSFSNQGSSSAISVPVIATESAAVQATNGPEVATEALPVIEGPAVTLPVVEGPLVTVSSDPIPPIRVLASRCICSKTVVRPQPYQRTVVLPRVQRYLKRTVTPVVENVAYKSRPVEQAQSTPVRSAVVVSSDNGSSDYQTGYGSSSVATISSGCQRVY